MKKKTCRITSAAAEAAADYILGLRPDKPDFAGMAAPVVSAARTCRMCGRSFVGGARRQYCVDCAVLARRISCRAYNRRLRDRTWAEHVQTGGRAFSAGA